MANQNEWTDVVLKINSVDVEKASAIAQMVISRGIYIEDYSDFDEEIKNFGPIEIIDEALLNKDKTEASLHIYFNSEENPLEGISFIKERFEAESIGYELITDIIRDEDWANNWKKYFKPCAIGEKLALIPSWELDSPEAEILSKNRTSLVIDPGMAFGSGQHETTTLCMELIEKYTTPESNLLDVGTGSGILAIASLLLGAKHATGIDIDALSVKVAKENAKINNVDDKFTGLQGDLALDVHDSYNLISANIVADIIIRLLPDMARLLSRDGIFIASGIIDTREADVVEILTANGLKVLETKRKRGWVALSAIWK